MPGFDSFYDLVLRFIGNFITAFIIIRLLYYPKGRRRDFLFTFFLFNALIFFVCSFLNSVEMDIGFAFGLFAIFTVLRYRTETIPIREMTYQFIVITLGAVNGLAGLENCLLELLFINLTVPVLTYVMDNNFLVKEESSQHILYEKIDLIKPGKRKELLEDLRKRTGLDIRRIRIGKINFLNDTVKMTVYYDEKKQNK